MSCTPVPAGGTEPPHDGATTLCLPTWLSRQSLVAEAGIEPAADEAYETTALPTELFRGVGIERTHRFSMLHARVQMAAPLGFEPSRPSSRPGALPARRRGNAIGATCGIRTHATRFEGPASSAARRTWRDWSGQRESNSRHRQAASILARRMRRPESLHTRQLVAETVLPPLSEPRLTELTSPPSLAPMRASYAGLIPPPLASFLQPGSGTPVATALLLAPRPDAEPLGQQPPPQQPPSPRQLASATTPAPLASPSAQSDLTIARPC
jgi:hypothetical protein